MIVTGRDFDLLRLRARVIYGAKDLDYSDRKNKKNVVTLKNGNRIHFGDKTYDDFFNTSRLEKTYTIPKKSVQDKR